MGRGFTRTSRSPSARIRSRWSGRHGPSSARGRNLATLQTLVSTCLANAVNPQDYLTDVLQRIDPTPQAELDTLMQWNWRAPQAD